MKSNVIREYKCKEGECELLAQAKYIGMTITTLSRRLTMHLQSGAIKLCPQTETYTTRLS